MANSAKYFRYFSICVLSVFLFSVADVTRLAAQVETATISGTATDSSGAALVGATVQARNVGTNISQSTVTDAAGRYRIPDLPIGAYELQTSLSGFQTVVHKGITLTVGANLVVDFSLPVGQVSQTVSVEGEVSRVETQTAAVSSLVTPQQMSQLPLNGRNFEQLLSLAPGVLTVKQAFVTGGAGGISSVFYGPSDTYSVAGSRPVEQVFLLDNQDLQGHLGEGSRCVNHRQFARCRGYPEISVAHQYLQCTIRRNRRGHERRQQVGNQCPSRFCLTEFLRNSALDVIRSFFDRTKIPPFRRNQFGGSLGGPVKKDKAFFFVNYEGLRSALGITGNQFISDALSRTGMVPCNTLAGQTPVTCANGQRTAVPVSPNVATYLKHLPGTTPGAIEADRGCWAVQGLSSGNCPVPNHCQNYRRARITF